MLRRSKSNPAILDRRADSGRPVLVIFPGALGDLICFAPALHALSRRHDDNAIHLLASSTLTRFAPDRLPISAAFSIDRREISLLFNDSGSAREIREFFRFYSTAYSFFASENAVYRRSLKFACTGAVSFHPFRPPGVEHIAEGYLSSLGLGHYPLKSRIEVLSGDLEAARTALEKANLECEQFVLLMPGSGSSAKNWPVSRFASLTAELEIPSAALLGPAEADLEPVFLHHRIPVLKDLDLGTVAGLARLCAIFVGNDSGVSHLAAATGARGVVIFGPTNPRRWRPIGKVAIIARPQLTDLAPSAVAKILRYELSKPRSNSQ